MSKIELNAREIIFLSALAEATELIGIPDGFYGMDELEIQQEVTKIQSELEKKGYAQADFDGNFNPDVEVMQVIQVCVMCEKLISFEKVSTAGNTKILFYLYDNRVIKVEAIADEFELTSINPADINPYMLEQIDWITREEHDIGQKVVIPHSLLQQIKDSIGNEFEPKKFTEELYKEGCSPIQAEIIYCGLSETSNYYSIIMIDFDSDVVSIMVINSNYGSLELKPVDTEEEGVEFQKIDYETFIEKLMDALSLIGITDGGDGFI